jgi:hypothetical protein
MQARQHQREHILSKDPQQTAVAAAAAAAFVDPLSFPASLSDHCINT